MGHRCQAAESDICVESLSLTQRARQVLLQYSTMVTININTLNMGGHLIQFNKTLQSNYPIDNNHKSVLVVYPEVQMYIN